ncbi:MAG: 1-acyl-sn-glycerol-3-phosphate acyltransferase [Candidatus Buchananbacteria bacterium]
MESFPRRVEKSGKELKETFYASTFKKMTERVRESGSEDVFSDVMEKYLETLNIKPVYEQELGQNPDLPEMRERLNSESGIIISNHPGYFDSLVILHLIRRKNIKVLVSQRTFPVISKILGPENFIEASHDPVQLKKQLREIKRHIESGGVLLIYPTGGADAIDSSRKDSELEFKSGFRFMVEGILRPEDMVYSFWVEPDDVADVLDEKIHRTIGTASDVVVGTKANVNKLKGTKSIRVNESYSKAGEWQEIVQGSESRDEADRALTEHYLDQFKRQK